MFLLFLIAGQNCDKVFYSDTALNGTIKSMNFPGPYPPKTYCRYEFQGRGKQRIQVNTNKIP